MIEIKEFEIQAGIDTLFNAPQLANLNTKDQLNKITSVFMNDLYLDQPREVLNYFKYQLNDRMITTIFKNYGIDESFYKDLNPLITKKLVYYLEYLFQTKGSLETFKIFDELFSSFYNNIDFYNITVSKIPVNSGNHKIAYILKPLKLSNDKEQTKFFPSADINLSGKYLMSLNQYHDYKFFPIDTNMIYIDFADSYGTSNNDEFFLQGIRAYTNTLLQGNSFQLFLGKTEVYEHVLFTDIELILEYMQLTLIRLGDLYSQKYFEVNTNALIYNTNLILKEEALPEIESILREYENADHANRKIMTSIKRRWQFILNNNKSNTKLYTTYEELSIYMKNEYPNIFDIAQLSTDINDFMDFYIQLYGTVLEMINKEDKYIAPYYSAVFQNVISGNLFIKNFFQPLFKIFVKYFFPASMDYTQQVGQLVKVKDKWNSIGTDENINNNLYINMFSPHLHFISTHFHTVRTKYLFNYNIIDVKPSTIVILSSTEKLSYEYLFKGIISSRVFHDYKIQDDVTTDIFFKDQDVVITNNKISTNILQVPLDLQRTLDLAITYIQSLFQEENILSSRNRSKQMPVDILIKTSDQHFINENIDCQRQKGNFYTTSLTLEEYEYKLARVSGLTSAGLEPLENYEVLMYDMYLTEDEAINTYKFYKYPYTD